MIKTLRQGQSTLERGTVAFVPPRIVRDRMSEIIHSKSKFIFSLEFFEPYALNAPNSWIRSSNDTQRLWTIFASDSSLIKYIEQAPFLKQTMRFVRLHHELMEDFEEEAQRIAGLRLSIDSPRPSHSAQNAPNTNTPNSRGARHQNSQNALGHSVRSPRSALNGTPYRLTDAVKEWANAQNSSHRPTGWAHISAPHRAKHSVPQRIYFSTPAVTFKDKDILQSFCINPVRCIA